MMEVPDFMLETPEAESVTAWMNAGSMVLLERAGSPFTR